MAGGSRFQGSICFSFRDNPKKPIFHVPIRKIGYFRWVWFKVAHYGLKMTAMVDLWQADHGSRALSALLFKIIPKNHLRHIKSCARGRSYCSEHTPPLGLWSSVLVNKYPYY